MTNWIRTSFNRLLSLSNSFYEPVPHVLIDTSAGIRDKETILFMVHYRAAYVPKGPAKLSEPGLLKDALNKLYLYRYDPGIKKLFNLAELTVKDPRQPNRPVNPLLEQTHLDLYDNRLLISLSYFSKGAYYPKSQIFSFDLTAGTFEKLVGEGTSPKISPDRQRIAFIKDLPGADQQQLHICDARGKGAEPAHPEALPIYRYRWLDNDNLVLESPGSEYVMCLNLQKGSVEPIEILKKHYLFDPHTTPRSETALLFKDMLYPGDIGLPDPLPFVRGENSDQELTRLILKMEGNRQLRLAAVGKLLTDKKESILRDVLDRYPFSEEAGNNAAREEEKKLIENIIDKGGL